MSENARRGTGQDPARRLAQGHSVSLQDQVTVDWRSPTAEQLGAGDHLRSNRAADGSPAKLGHRVYNRNRKLTIIDLNRQVAMTEEWPTPQSHDTRGRGPGFAATGGHTKPHDLHSKVTGSWPTPRREDSENCGGDTERHGTLTSSARDWSTPNTMTGGQTSRGGARKAEKLLGGQVRETWPTPTAGDSIGAGNRNLEGSKAHPGDSLSDIVRGGQAPRRDWPTPRESEHKGTGPKGSKSQVHRLKRCYLDATVEEEDGLPDQESRSTTGSSPDSWPTPASQGPNGGPHGLGGGTAANQKLVRTGNPKMRSGSLNSEWVAQLQGYPHDWCVLPDETIAKLSKRTGTPSSPK